jgi:hypothetical protein
MRIIFRNTACDGIRRDAMQCASTALEFQNINLYSSIMKFIKLTIIALVCLLVTTTSCEKEEPTPAPPTHLGLWELTAIRTVLYENSKKKYEKTETFDSNKDAISRLYFKDSMNGEWISKYPNDEEPQEKTPFTYAIQGSKLIITDSADSYTYEELNIQAQTLTLGQYPSGITINDPVWYVEYLIYKRL